MPPELIERIKRDFNKEKSILDWDSYLAGYMSAVKRFGGKKEDRRETKSKLGYARIGVKY